MGEYPVAARRGRVEGHPLRVRSPRGGRVARRWRPGWAWVGGASGPRRASKMEQARIFSRPPLDSSQVIDGTGLRLLVARLCVEPQHKASDQSSRLAMVRDQSEEHLPAKAASILYGLDLGAIVGEIEQAAGEVFAPCRGRFGPRRRFAEPDRLHSH